LIAVHHHVVKRVVVQFGREDPVVRAELKVLDVYR
jgi:hypothetical protein